MRQLISIVVALVLLAARVADATVLVSADLGDLARGARAIVRGRVVAVEPQWTADRRAIETVVTLEADAYLKGSLGATVRFLVPGGALGRYRSVFVGAPTFAAGDRIVVFLGARGPTFPYVLGLSQGVFRIAPDGSSWVVTPPAVLPIATGSAIVVRGDMGRRPLPLSDFEARVRALAGGER